MPAYQIQVQGELDGTTAFVMPTTLPAPDNGGVIKIDAGAGVNVGTFDLNALAGTDGTPVWVRALHVEYAALTRAARINGDISGSQAPDTVIPDIADANAAPLMRPNVLSKSIIMPIGAELDILTDDTDDTFSGSPVAGPHFIYIDVEPIRDDEQMALIQDLAAFAGVKSDAEGEVYQSVQAVAASLTEEIGIVNLPSKGVTAQQAQIVEASVSVGDAPAAGESMLIILQAVTVGTGTAVELGRVTLSNPGTTAYSNTVIPINNPGNDGLINGSRIRVVRTYTAGGGPTPMTQTTVRAKIAPIQLT